MRDQRPTSHTSQAAPIDWRAIHRRLESVRAAIERGFAPTAEAKKEVLRNRAKALARQAQPAGLDHAHIEIVEFLLAYERYGIESSYIGGVHPLRELTPVPCTPPFVLGVINLRGHILSVIDIKRFFDLPERGLTDLNKVLVVRTDRMELGILADVILGVHRIPIHDLQPSLPTLTGIRAEYLQGVTKDRVVVLDVEKILSDRKIIVHEEMEK